MIPSAVQLAAIASDGPVKLRITKRPSVGPSPHVEVTAEVVSLKRGIVVWRDEDGRTIEPRDSWLYETLRGVPVGAAIATTPAEKAREARDESAMDELRDYGVGAQILTELGVHDMILLTNARHTLIALDGYGLSIVGERPIPTQEEKA